MDPVDPVDPDVNKAYDGGETSEDCDLDAYKACQVQYRVDFDFAARETCVFASGCVTCCKNYDPDATPVDPVDPVTPQQ